MFPSVPLSSLVIKSIIVSLRFVAIFRGSFFFLEWSSDESIRQQIDKNRHTMALVLFILQ